MPESVITEHRNLGIAFYKARMYSDAAREFKRITELRASDSAAAFYLGLIALQGKHDGMTPRRRFSAPRSPLRGLAAVLVNMAYAYERMGQLGKARLALEQVVARSEKPEPLAHLGLASLALQRGDVERPQLTRMQRAMRGVAARLRLRGFITREWKPVMRGDPRQAGSILAEGVSRYPSSAVLLNNLRCAGSLRKFRRGTGRTRARRENRLRNAAALPQSRRFTRPPSREEAQAATACSTAVQLASR